MTRRAPFLTIAWSGRWLVSAASLAVSSLLPACGARTSLDIGAVDGGGPVDGGGAGGAGGNVPSCGAPDPTEPLRIKLRYEVGYAASVASSGCTFAVAWSTPSDTAYVIRAQTVRVVDGAWTVSEPNVIATGPNPTGDGNLGFPSLLWDGSTYVVVWADTTLHFQRMADDATIMGPVVDGSFAVPALAYLVWAEAQQGPSGEFLRVAVQADEVEFARVSADDGSTLVALTPVTTPCGSFGEGENYGFANLGADNVALAAYQGETSGRDDTRFIATHFDDEGSVTQACVDVLEATDITVARQSVVGAADTIYFGLSAFDHDADRTVVGQLTTDGFTPVSGVNATTAPPALAVDGKGDLGILTPSSNGLSFAVARGVAVTSTRVVEKSTEGVDDYELAGGAGVFGALWVTQHGDARFTLFTP